MVLNLKVKFFASCKEKFGNEVDLKIEKSKLTVEELISELEENKIDIKNDFENGNVIISYDFEIMSNEDIIEKDGELGIYPPVSGG
ncbi:MoaD/ThiS family protein [Methanococcus voltae]|uniref:Molybdopterin synthase sulfur carrier subunit n=1 Tax=Methanococcus voltae TaxID=2188 RepID=A0A8J7UU39_METVO|nr:MoaD/ThiS family protein [Methanococcus voltae]MBP2172102.1 molybdopterin synthase sulfur carrier subunit [Methanococcus voltae]MBP2200941.1 molybdopterin synthase sulfur carrier subunit [Methanococcus voltae]